MNLKELNTYMRTNSTALLPSQQIALEALGIAVEYEWFGPIPQARTDILLTSEPVEGKVLMELHKNLDSYFSLTCYDAVQSPTVRVNICTAHPVRLFGEIPNSLYVTKKETQNE